MNDEKERKLREFLQRNITRADLEPRRDLWPQALARLAERERQAPWFDWALLGLVAACLLLFPKAIPVLLYHL